MVKFGGEIGTLYQIFTPCTPLPKYKRAFTGFLGANNRGAIWIFFVETQDFKYVGE